MNTNNITSIVQQVTYSIIHQQDYSLAARIMIENAMTLETLCKHTLKLSQLQIAKLADSILNNK